MSVLRRVFLALLVIGWTGPALAAFKICNESDYVQTVSIGYKGADDWTSHGWWNIDPKACTIVIAEDLTGQFYYYRAEVDGGEFTGENIFFCTTNQAYTIVGDADCQGRGYEREAFSQIDTGAGVTDYTLTLVNAAPTTTPPVSVPASTATTTDSGLTICNGTDQRQTVAIGYKGEADWISKGWWNIEKSQCTLVIGDPLKKQFYYYRAEVDGGPFQGDGYGFCTTQQPFEIVGGTECAARGYEGEDFAEIDVGQGVKGFTFTLANTTAAPPAEPAPVAPVAPTTAGGLSICNDTDQKNVVAIGYLGETDWTSKGWWAIEPKACARVLEGALKPQMYYYYAEVDGVSVQGGNSGFCLSQQPFEIIGATECAGRGFEAENFAEIERDLGVTEFAFHLVSAAAAPPVQPAPVAPPVQTAPETPPVQTAPETPPALAATDLGLTICNQTAFVQGLSIAYKGEADWTSEGWWNIEPKACVLVRGGELKQRYYFYRAEIDGGPFNVGTFAFCTSPKVYNIVGNKDCASRGYETENFAEIDTGTSAKGFTLTLVPDPAAPTGKEEPRPDTGSAPESRALPKSGKSP